MMRYSEETVTDAFLDEAMPLFKGHAKELNVLDAELDVNRLVYFKAVANESFKSYTIRDDGKLVGYVGYWLLQHPHYDHKTAQQDVLYLKKRYRKGMTGLKLLKYSEKKLKEAGATLIVQSTKMHKDLSKFYEYLGYKESDRIFVKET